MLINKLEMFMWDSPSSSNYFAGVGPVIAIWSTEQVRVAILLFLLVFIGLNAGAQEPSPGDTPSINQIKINLLPLAVLNSAELSYERTIKPQLNLGASVALNVRQSPPVFLDLGRFSDLSFSGNRFRNFSFLQQLKWFPETDKGCAPQGFYIGGLFRFQSISYSSTILLEAVETDVEVGLDALLNAVGVGVEVGYQFRFKEHFLLDFSFFGPQRNFCTFIGTLDTEVDSAFLEALADEVNGAIGFGLFDPDLNFTQTLARRFSVWSIRYAVSVGYTF